MYSILLSIFLLITPIQDSLTVSQSRLERLEKRVESLELRLQKYESAEKHFNSILTTERSWWASERAWWVFIAAAIVTGIGYISRNYVDRRLEEVEEVKRDMDDFRDDFWDLKDSYLRTSSNVSRTSSNMYGIKGQYNKSFIMWISAINSLNELTEVEDTDKSNMETYAHSAFFTFNKAIEEEQTLHDDNYMIVREQLSRLIGDTSGIVDQILGNIFSNLNKLKRDREDNGTDASEEE